MQVPQWDNELDRVVEDSYDYVVGFSHPDHSCTPLAQFNDKDQARAYAAWLSTKDTAVTTYVGDAWGYEHYHFGNKVHNYEEGRA